MHAVLDRKSNRAEKRRAIPPSTPSDAVFPRLVPFYGRGQLFHSIRRDPDNAR